MDGRGIADGRPAGCPPARDLAAASVPYVLVAALITAGLAPYAAVGTFLTLPLALRAAAARRRGDRKDLARTAGRAGVLFGLLLLVAFPVAQLDFWWQMSLVSLVTGGLAVRFAPRDVCRNIVFEAALAVVLAGVLWVVFWIGDQVSQLLFAFARGQVDMIYALREGQSAELIGVLLLVLIGPAEELFWRGLVQHRLALRLGPNAGFALATLAYTLIHVWSGNFMLIGAAAVCGLCWGGFYRFFPRHLPALVLSHALWDALAFVYVPIG